MPEWRITRLRKEFALTYDRGGRRHRHSLKTNDAGEAQRRAPALFAELTRPTGATVDALWKGYTLDKEGRAVLNTMKHTWKALEPHFGRRDGDLITVDECRAYTAARRKAGKSDGSIHTELGHLRTVLKWAERKRIISRAPDIERPQKPLPKERHLSREEFRKLLAVNSLPHVKLAMHLMLATAARVSAVLELTWDRIDFKRRLIHLVDPDDKTKRKARAIVPMNDTIFAALHEAKKTALSDYVIEWGGEKVKSIKRSIATAAGKANVPDVSPHVFRHTAAVWMAEAGIPMSEISQFLGHSNMSITIKVYARYSPDHLRKAASALEMGIYEVPSGALEPQEKNSDRT